MIALLLTLALATAPGDSVPVLPGVGVATERALDQARRRLPTAFVTALPAREPGRALETVSDVLSRVAGVRVQQYGGLGAFSTVSLRGAPAGQTTVYLDGVPLSAAAHGAVNLADLPATAIERVEVYRSLSPLALGPATPGGAINLVTVANPDVRELHVVRGSTDLWEARGTAGIVRGPWSLLAHGGYQGARGDFEYFDDNGTPFNAVDDSVSRRLNNRFDSGASLARLAFARGALRARLRHELFHKQQGLPGLGQTPARNTSIGLTRSLTALELEREGRAWWPSLATRAALDREHTQFADRTGELGFGRHDTDDRIGFEDLTATLEWPLRGFAAVEATGSLRRDRAELRDAADGWPDPPASTRRGRGAAVVVRVTPWDGRITLFGGHRWDVVRDERRWSATTGVARASELTREWRTPQAGMRIVVGAGLELRGNWTDARRAPTFVELFGNSGSILGNPELRSERGRQHDLGFGWSARRRGVAMTLEGAHFDSRSEDVIVLVRNSVSTAKARNVSQARVRGEELAARVTLPFGLGISGAASWLDAIDEGPVSAWRGRQLPMRPVRQAQVALDLAVRRMRLRVDLQHLGENWLDPANRQRIAPRTLVGASLGWNPLGEAFGVVLEGRNLGDDQVADIGGYPLPGRTVLVALQTRHHPAPAFHR